MSVNLSEEDLAPLLQATASRSLDTCLRGARGLAVLGDPRAFGLLLQLSREDDAGARAEVCRALGALDDPRSVNRLRSLLYDPDPAVRDAAFTALARLLDKEPFQAAEAGLSTGFEDVRRRGLQVLVERLRKAKPVPAEPVEEGIARGVSDRAEWQLLVRALNDSSASVRSEAFKSTLNLKVAGGGVRTLRFVLQSIHPDVRREVLTEVTAQAQEGWAWNLLLEFFNDPDPGLRAEAFNFAVKKTKELGPLEASLRSQYPDARKLAVEGLIKKHTNAAQALLVRALADADKDVRQLALGALVGADAKGPLTEALTNPHADVRVRAGSALARHGDKAALTPLLQLATAPEPAEKERVADWTSLASQALDGLAKLGDAGALVSLVPLLQSPHEAIRKGAGRALAWTALPQHSDTLRQALQHADPKVKYAAALGLALAGDPLAAALVFSDEAAQALTPGERLAAALTLGPAGEDQLASFLDSPEEAVRDRALFIHLLLELAAPREAPVRCLACLAALTARVRLTGARALEVYADRNALLEYVTQQVNDRGDSPAWKIQPKVVEPLALLLAHGSPATKARTVLITQHLTGTEQAAWDQAWDVHAERYAAEIVNLERTAGKAPRPPQRYTPEQLRDLAFGGYIGLVREQGSSASRGPAPQVVRVRQTALNRVLGMVKDDKRFDRSARAVLVQALGDPNQAVRVLAFEHLLTLGMDKAALGAEALATGHLDLGVKGLELLTGGAARAEGQAALEEAMLTRTDDLALEAGKLLLPHKGVVAVAAAATRAAHGPVRQWGVTQLAGEYDHSPAAKEQLRKALDSRHARVRETAATELATKKDPAAFDALVKMLAETEAPRIRRAVEALTTLGDPRAVGALLDRLENDPGGTAPADELLQAAGNFRRPESADRLLKFAERDAARRSKLLDAVLSVSGFDQGVEDPDEEGTASDPEWERKQHPRHGAVLARLMEVALKLRAADTLSQLIPAARWARGKEVEPALAALAAHADDELRRQAVEAVGWRLRKRNGPAEPLLKALTHRDEVTQFLAAEGLAKGGRAEGLNVLLAGVELLEDPELRGRAVLALGELGDARSVGLLLKLANEPEHDLRNAAVEAIGHLGRSSKGEEIFQLLERLAGGSNDHAAEQAVKGLRWLNTPAGWDLIRRRAGDPNCGFRSEAVELLGHDDEPASRELLLKVLAEEEENGVVEAAMKAARRLWGKTSLEPDYAVLQNPEVNFDYWYWDEEVRSARERVLEKGEPKRVFEILPRCQQAVQQVLAAGLLNRPDLPVDQARAGLNSPDEKTAQLAAQILGRLGDRGKDTGKALADALTKWLGVWEERRKAMIRTNTKDPKLAERFTPCLQSLVWAAGRLGAPADSLITVASTRPDDPEFRPVRREAVSALVSGTMSKEVAAALEKFAATDNDPEVRELAAEAIGRHDAKRAADLAGKVIGDRASLNRLLAGGKVEAAKELRSAAAQSNAQGVAVPHLVARADVEGLKAVATDKKLPEPVRMGAIEGLAAVAKPEAEAVLTAIGQGEKEPEELRRAAWRGLKRSRRARKKAEAAPKT